MISSSSSSASEPRSFAQSTSALVEQSLAADHPKADYDVAIAGGGIAGLTLACALKQSGLRVALIEAHPKETGFKRRRAYALTLMSGQIFSGLGIWKDILPHITTFSQIRLADENYPTVVDLCPDDIGAQELGYVAEHHVLVKVLYQALEDAPTLTWYCPTTLDSFEVQPQHVTLNLIANGEHFSLRTRLLVAADGPRSPIRQQAGITTGGWPYWQSCVTTVIRPEKSHGNIAREHFWETGPFATLPLPDNRAQIVLTAPHQQAQALLEMDESSFIQELERRYGGQLGRIQLVEERFLFPVQLMQSQRYVAPRLALVGDAAHCCHPVGGQGLNLGIRDVAALAQVLKWACSHQEDIGSLAVLKRYERWRKLENLVILGFTDFLDRLFSNRWLPLVWLRHLGLRLMRSLRSPRFLALKLMTGLSGRIPDLAKPRLRPVK